MPTILHSEERLLDLLDTVESTLYAAALSAVTAIQQSGSLSRARIERLIEQGRIEEAIIEAGRIGAISINNSYAAVYGLAGRQATGLADDALRVTIGFDAVNSRAVGHLQAVRLRLISEITEQQREAISQSLTDGLTSGLNPRQQAIDVRRSIGLTAPQRRAVENYRLALERGSADALDRQLRDRRSDSSVRRAIREGRPLSARQIDSMVERYRSRTLRYRARTIARTESLRALHAGSDEGYRQIIESASVDVSEIVRTWHTARDERVRPTHVAASGQKRGLDESFVVGGVLLRYPGDSRGPARETVRCRCIATARIRARVAG